MPRNATRRTTAALRVVAVLLVSLSLLPEAFGMLSGSQCRTWQNRTIDLKDAYEAARNLPRLEQNSVSPIREEEAKKYLALRRQKKPEWLIEDAAEWAVGRYSGCGIVDSMEATTSRRESARYASLAWSARSYDANPARIEAR